jgi:hypothetical protein
MKKITDGVQGTLQDGSIQSENVLRAWKKRPFTLDSSITSDRMLLKALLEQGIAIQELIPYQSWSSWFECSFCNDLTIMLWAVQQDGCALQYASKELRNNTTLVEAAVRHNGNALKYASDAMRDNSEIALIATRRNPEVFQCVSARLANTREFLIDVVSWNHNIFDHIPNYWMTQENINEGRRRRELRSLSQEYDFEPEKLPKWFWIDMDFMSTAIKENDWQALLKNYSVFESNETFMLALIKKYAWQNLLEVYPNFSNNEAFMLAVIKKHDWKKLLESVPLFQNNSTFILAAVRQDAAAFECASEDIQEDEEIVLAAVKRNGLVLQYVLEDFLDDKKIVLAAVKQNCEAFRCVPLESDLMTDTGFMRSLVKRQPWLEFLKVFPELKKNEAFMLAAIKQHTNAIEFAASELLDDRDFIETAVKLNGHIFSKIASKFQEDEKIIESAVQQCGLILQARDGKFQNNATKGFGSIFHRFQENQEFKLSLVTPHDAHTFLTTFSWLGMSKTFMLLALKLDASIFQHQNRMFTYRNDREFILIALKENGLVLEYLDNGFKYDKEIVLAAVKQNGMALKHASDVLKNDLTIIAEALLQTSNSWQHIPEELRKLYWLQDFASGTQEEKNFHGNIWKSYEYKQFSDVEIIATYDTNRAKITENDLVAASFFKQHASTIASFFTRTEERELKELLKKMQNKDSYTLESRELFFKIFLEKVSLEKEVTEFLKNKKLDCKKVISDFEESLKTTERKSEKPLSITKPGKK